MGEGEGEREGLGEERLRLLSYLFSSAFSSLEQSEVVHTTAMIDRQGSASLNALVFID